MDFYEFKTALSQKITSKEELDSLLIRYQNYNQDFIGKPAVKQPGGTVVLREQVYNIGGMYPAPVGDWMDLCFSPMSGIAYGRFHYTRWWMVREWLRVRVGIYQMTEPLWDMARQGYADWCAHCTTKTDDPTMVAYTPDAAAGEADRQITIALGKLLRKLTLAAPDHTIQAAEAAHRADLTSELEILPPSEMPKLMLEIGESAGGLSSCMTKPMSYWSRNEGHHPYEVYDAPGFGMAVTRNVRGKVNARALVWVNPANPEDKRYVRIYGDGSLKRRLARHGYRMAGLEGARLKRIDLPNHPDIRGYSTYGALLGAYLDVPGGSGSGVSECSAQHGVFDGDSYILLVSSGTVHRLGRSVGLQCLNMSTTSGAVVYEKARIATSASQLATCPITGRQYNMLEAKTVLVLCSGMDKPVRALDVPEVSQGRNRVSMLDEHENVVTALADADIPTFDHQGALWADTAQHREWHGYVRPSTVFYPHMAGQWANVGAWLPVPAVLPNDEEPSPNRSELVYQEDTVHFIHGGTTWAVHGSLVNDTKKIVPVHRLNSERPAFTYKDNPDLVTTRTGRKAVRGVHSITQCWDGVWDFSRNVDSFTDLGFRIHYTSRMGRPTLEQYRPFLLEKIKTDIDGRASSYAARPGRDAPTQEDRDRAGTFLTYRVAYYGYTKPEWKGNSWVVSACTMPEPKYSMDEAVSYMYWMFDWARGILNEQITVAERHRYRTLPEDKVIANLLLLIESVVKQREGIDASPLVAPAPAPVVQPEPAMDERFVLAA